MLGVWSSPTLALMIHTPWIPPCRWTTWPSCTFVCRRLSVCANVPGIVNQSLCWTICDVGRAPWYQMVPGRIDTETRHPYHARRMNDQASTTSRLYQVVQLLANVAVIVAGVAVVLLMHQRIGSDTQKGPETYAVGEPMDALEGIDFTSADQTLVLALREDCVFCQQSIGFYKSISDRRRASGGGPRLLVVSTDAVLSMREYLDSHGVAVDGVIQYAPGSLKIAGTPALFVVDSTRTVRRVWRGMLPRPVEQEVYEELGLKESR